MGRCSFMVPPYHMSHAIHHLSHITQNTICICTKNQGRRIKFSAWGSLHQVDEPPAQGSHRGNQWKCQGWYSIDFHRKCFKKILALQYIWYFWKYYKLGTMINFCHPKREKKTLYLEFIQSWKHYMVGHDLPVIFTTYMYMYKHTAHCCCTLQLF